MAVNIYFSCLCQQKNNLYKSCFGTKRVFCPKVGAAEAASAGHVNGACCGLKGDAETINPHCLTIWRH